jgi:hypothetical protein
VGIRGALSRIEARLGSPSESIESNFSLSDRTCHTNAQHEVSISSRASASLVLDTNSPKYPHRALEHAEAATRFSSILKIQRDEQASSISELKNAVQVLSQITKTLVVQQKLSSQSMTALQSKPRDVLIPDLSQMKEELSAMYAMNFHSGMCY